MTRRVTVSTRDETIVGPLVELAAQQLVEFLADEQGRRYSPHWPEPSCRVLALTTWLLRPIPLIGT